MPFLIALCRSSEVATILVNSDLFKELLTLAKQSTLQSLASGYLLLFASIVSSAKSDQIQPSQLSKENLSPLSELINAGPKVASKAIICIGEIGYYIASATAPLAFPSFNYKTLCYSCNC